MFECVCLTLASLIICCSDSFWMIDFFTTGDRMKGNWQKENLQREKDVFIEKVLKLYTRKATKNDTGCETSSVNWTERLHMLVG